MIYDVVVIGGGQAGLSMGYFLQKTNLNFVILDKHKQVGEVWRDRYDSLVLFTPRSYSQLPGLPFKGDPSTFPNKNEIADYLEEYARTFSLPIQLGTEVQQLDKLDDGFQITTTNTIIKAKRVIIATGPFQSPRIPSFANQLSNEIIQLHSSQYKNPDQLKPGSVLVVGGGNSGAQIAVELSESHDTYLSISQNIRHLPLVLGGKSIFWWFDHLGILRTNKNSFIGKKIRQQGDPIFGFELKEKVKSKKIRILSRAFDSSEEEVLFEDHSPIKVENVIWATGFESNYSWINIPHVFDSGKPKHNRGMTEVDGLYFLGLPWQFRRGSALLLGVGYDAQFIYEHLIESRN